MTPRARLRRKWAEDQKAFADKWFDGDEAFALAFLEILPYSEIPGWSDADAVMELLATREAMR